jgi:Cytochrome P460
MTIKLTLSVLTFLLMAAGFGASSGPRAIDPSSEAAQFTPSNQMLRPEKYREWVWLSSGFGMSYQPRASAENPDFDNVFVNPTAYRAFLATGRWPDKTVLVLEVRHSESRGSINQGGHFQSSLSALEVHVKDDKRFPGGWAFFGFGASSAGTLLPKSASCYSCHEQHGAVDTTFVQFYPTLLEVARQKKTGIERSDPGK